MAREVLIPKDGPPDIRAIHRFAMSRTATARRQGDARTIRLWRRLAVKALRALRFAARIEAGRAHAHPHSSHPLFSDAPEKVRGTAAVAVPPDPDRRRTFREERRRR